ncbi:MAG: hypothetical protein KAI64_04555, partial [Thermoplasmata archaeon]|nr:hypothetical protein [Thermoplasmata archaeon]
MELKSPPPSGQFEELAYISNQPNDVRVDGAFADWNDVTGYQQSNGSSYGGMGIEDYRVETVNSNLSMFLEVGGRMLGGTRIPYRNRAEAEPVPPTIVVDSDRDSVPDGYDAFPYDFNNDGILDIDENLDVDGDGVNDHPYGTDYILETVIPDSFPVPYNGTSRAVYIGPVIRPPITGEDKVYAYVDKDKDPDTGYKVNGIGADHMILVSGKYGKVLSTGYHKFSNAPNSTTWMKEGDDLLVETDYSRMEAQL